MLGFVISFGQNGIESRYFVHIGIVFLSMSIHCYRELFILLCVSSCAVMKEAFSRMTVVVAVQLILLLEEGRTISVEVDRERHAENESRTVVILLHVVRHSKVFRTRKNICTCQVWSISILFIEMLG